MKTFRLAALAGTLCSMIATTAYALTPGEVRRIDADRVEISWTDEDPVTIRVSEAPDAALSQARLVASGLRGGRYTVAAPAGTRLYFVLQDGGDGSQARVAERQIPLQQASNFRDIGGYATADGRRVKWGRIYRAGAVPMLTESDYAAVAKLGLGTVVDLRSTDERQIAPDLIDDRTGALFVSNDYAFKPLYESMAGGDGEYLYRGVGKALAPQYRAIFRRLLANDGALLYHCSAGQDRTGVATALIYSALGAPRETIVRDYHLSTALRRPQFEMPTINPADWPGNLIATFYAASQKRPGGPVAEPLYSPKGNSHLAQFFETIDRDYGSVEAYLDKELGVTAQDVARLKQLYLE